MWLLWWPSDVDILISINFSPSFLDQEKQVWVQPGQKTMASDASHMLEAALEQMDDIIAGMAMLYV